MDEIWTRKRFENLYSVPYRMSLFLFRKLIQIRRTIFDVTIWFGSKLFEFAVMGIICSLWMLLFKFIGKLHEINQIICVLAFLNTVASLFESTIRLSSARGFVSP